MNISMWDGWCEVIGHVGNLCSVYETGQIAYGTRIVRWKKNPWQSCHGWFVGWFLWHKRFTTYIPIVSHYIPYPVIYRYISLFQCHEKSSTDHVHDMRIRSNIWGYFHRRAPSDQSSPYFGQNPPLLVERCRCPVGFAQRNWQRLNRYEQINGTCRWLISDNLSILDE